jgi:hypothetical protein
MTHEPSSLTHHLKQGLAHSFAHDVFSALFQGAALSLPTVLTWALDVERGVIEVIVSTLPVTLAAAAIGYYVASEDGLSEIAAEFDHKKWHGLGVVVQTVKVVGAAGGIVVMFGLVLVFTAGLTHWLAPRATLHPSDINFNASPMGPPIIVPYFRAYGPWFLSSIVWGALVGVELSRRQRKRQLAIWNRRHELLNDLVAIVAAERAVLATEWFPDDEKQELILLIDRTVRALKEVEWSKVNDVTTKLDFSEVRRAKDDFHKCIRRVKARIATNPLTWAQYTAWERGLSVEAYMNEERQERERWLSNHLTPNA